ncbi:hypothetical protein [Xanthobacter aminoxidans]|uniref:hypothetical protein n=1 Tax=Xanthobacter aminoxidans TaxID=186280 RepID=UPI002022C67C|nr:hypothetical protein [Xanthobacter aminoxidans]MCL8385792.1 hypothetical protein [Xanthobacter aminoxidans]
MQKLDEFPYLVLSSANQDYDLALPAFGRFERIEWPLDSEGEFRRPLRFTGLLDLEAPHALAHLDSLVWAVVQIDQDDPCEWATGEDGTRQPGVVCFASGFVLFRGARETALSIFAACKGGASLKTPLSAFQDRSGVAIAGDYGTAIAGDEGFARAGFCGLAKAGTPGTLNPRHPLQKVEYSSFGVALAGVHGTAFAGTAGVAVVESGGTARAGNGGVAIARSDGNLCTVEVGREGVAISRATDGMVIAGDKAVAVASSGGRWLKVGHGGIGVAMKHMETLVIADEALVIAAAWQHNSGVRLGRQATLICRLGADSGFTRITTCGGALEPGTYAIWNGELTRIWDENIEVPNISFLAWKEKAKDRAPASEAPSFASGVPWWEAARSHDPLAEILPEAIPEGQIIVLCADIPSAELEAGRKDGEWWLGAPFGQGELPLIDGAPCCLVRVEGEHAFEQGGGEAVCFQRGTALYRGSLRGAVAALRAIGANTALNGRVARAGHGGVARVPSRMAPMPPPPPSHLYHSEELVWETPYNVLRGDRTMGRDTSLAVAGDEGFAICDGEAHAGDYGVARVTGLGLARAGRGGLAFCENGRALAGDLGFAFSRLSGGERRTSSGLAAAGWCGVAIAEPDGSAAIAGNGGIAIAMGTGLARVGTYGVAIGPTSKTVDLHGGSDSVVVARDGRVSGDHRALLVAWDAGTERWIAAVVGRDGIEPGIPYVARNGWFEPQVPVAPEVGDESHRQTLH